MGTFIFLFFSNLHQMVSVLIETEEKKRQTQKDTESHEKTQIRTGMAHLQNRGHQGLLKLPEVLQTVSLTEP